MKKLIVPLVLGFVGSFGAIAIYHHAILPSAKVVGTEEKAPIQQVNLPIATNTNGELIDFTYAAKAATDAVVHVKTEKEVQGYYSPLQQFFGMPESTRRAQGSGSGVIVSNDGFIVTNNHVIDGADDITVALNNGVEMKAELIGADASTDLALLKIEGNEYTFVPYGNSDAIEIGQWVLAIGNPFNLQSTVTAGIVSAKSRNIDLLKYDPITGQVPLESFIQTDAAVNPGNSGGALVGINGELLGINTAIASNTGSYAGYSFAIPANIVKKVVGDLYEFGTVQRAFIGVNIRDLSSELVNELNLKSYEGVYVAGLNEGGAAEEGGVKEGDVITHVENIQVKKATELQEQIGKHRPGDRVKLTLIRDAKELQKTVTLRNIHGTTSMKSKAEQFHSQLLDAKLEVADKALLQKLNVKHGVRLNEVENLSLLRSGMKPGFIITHIDKTPVKKPQDVDSILKSRKGGILIEGYYPNGKKAYFGVGV